MDANPDIAQALAAPFKPEEYKARVEEGVTKSGQPYHREFTYVEDEKVMQRLDDVFGVLGWELRVEAAGPNVAKVTIIAGDVRREDYGYAENAKDPLKEAVTDGIRRVGRMFGIARDVYEGKVAPGGGAIAPRQTQAQPAVQQPVNAVAAARQVFGDDLVEPKRGDACPKHGTPLNGGDKGPADLYHKTGAALPSGKPEYCRPYAPPRGQR